MNTPSHPTPEVQESTSGFWLDVWHGASRASVAGTIGIIVVVGLLCGLSVLWVKPRHLVKLDHRYLMTVHLDDYTELSFEAMRAKQAGPQPFAVAVVGDSAIRSAMPDTSAIQGRLAQELGRDVPVHYLAAKGMNLIEYAGVMDYIGQGFNGVVVIQMSLYHIAQTPKELAILLEIPRMAIDTPVYDQELARVAGSAPWRSGVYLLDHWRFYAYRLNEHALWNVLFGPTPLPLASKPMTTEQWQTADRNVLAYLKEYPTQRDRNLAILGRLIDRLRAQGRVEIAIVETPMNPRWHKQINSELAQGYQEYWENWIQEQGLHHWDLNREGAFATEDFHDYVHFCSREAGQRYTDLLMDHVAELASSWQAREGRP